VTREDARAPRLQPNVTEHETTGEQILLMRRTEGTKQAEATGYADRPPDLKPWHEVGWIFRDGGCIAIERLGDEVRARASAG